MKQVILHRDSSIFGSAQRSAIALAVRNTRQISAIFAMLPTSPNLLRFNASMDGGAH